MVIVLIEARVPIAVVYRLVLVDVCLSVQWPLISLVL